LIGLKQNNNGGVFKVKLKVPLVPYFTCHNSSKLSILETQLSNLGQSVYDNTRSYYEAQKLVLRKLNSELNYLKECCGNRFTSCNDCPTESEVKATMVALGFRAIPIKFISDQPPTLRDSISKSNRQTSNVMGEQNLKILINGQEILAVDYMSTQLSSVQSYSLTASGFITKNQNLCNSSTVFDNITSEYSSSTSAVKIWWHVWDDPNSNEDYIFEMVEGMDFLGEKLYDDFTNTVLSQIEAEEIGNRLGDCHGTNKAFKIPDLIYESADNEGYTKVEGNLAHNCIFAFYKLLYLQNDIEFDYYIKNASSNGTLTSGYADIVDKTDKLIYEVKSVRSAIKYGDSQVQNYVDKYNKYCVSSKNDYVRRGGQIPGEFPVKTILSTYPHPKKKLIVHLHKQIKEKGVISYELTEREKRRPKEPYKIPPIIRANLKNIFDEVKNSGKNSEAKVIDIITLDKENIAAYTGVALAIIAGGVLVEAGAAALAIGTSGVGTGAAAVISLAGAELILAGAILTSAIIVVQLNSY
jgi:hypothetical protein